MAFMILGLVFFLAGVSLAILGIYFVACTMSMLVSIVQSLWK